MTVNINDLRALTPPAGMPFKIQRLGHVASEWKGVKTLEAASADLVMGQNTIIAR